MLPAYAENINNLDGGKDRKEGFFMKKSKLFLKGILGLLLVFGLVLAGCDNDGGGGDNNGSGDGGGDWGGDPTLYVRM